MAEVYIDNKFVGWIDNPKEFVESVRKLRREGKLPKTLNIRYEEETDTVFINISGNRLLRPLIVVENGKPKLTKEHIEKLKKGELRWKDLEEQGIIEWLDPMEEEDAYIALEESEVTKKHTHLEISPMLMFGILTSLVPYANHNQAVRLNRGVRPQRQALSIYALNYLLRFDSDISILYYPQEPIVRTITHEIFKNEDIIGQNVVVAVMTMEGYNMEDALVFNKGSIERGLFRGVFFRPYEITEQKYPGGLKDEICIPDPDVKAYKGEDAYRHLEEDGIVYPEAEVYGGDVLVGRVSPPRFTEVGPFEEISVVGLTKRDTSLSVRAEEKGIVDFVLITEDINGDKLVKVRVRDLRIPELGDKFCARSGQKGVIGLILDETDMPYTASGVVPDILFSPMGIPSRQTVGYLLELLAGKVGCLSGRYIDGTPWMEEPEKELRKKLLELGFREDGTETMYNPITGEEYKVKIFVGNIYYMRLKHMAANKLHARARGPVTLLTRQPTEGKAKGGGLRLGEMEKDVLLGHGASLLLKERFSSDKTYIYVCEKCGSMAIEDTIRNRKYCPVCEETEKISKVEVSYAFKLFLDELISLGIWPKIKLKDKF